MQGWRRDGAVAIIEFRDDQLTAAVNSRDRIQVLDRVGGEAVNGEDSVPA
jgi:hypothetical protein